MRHRPDRQRGDKCVNHHAGDFLYIAGIDHIAAIPGKAGALSVMLPRWIEPHDFAVLDHLQTSADMDGGSRNHLAFLDQAELGGAAANVDV